MVVNKELLEWKNVKLVKYEEKYFNYIYNEYQDYNSRYLFTNDLNITSKSKMWEILNKKLINNYHEFMIIVNKQTNLPIGFIYSYDYDVRNNYLYITLFIEKKSRNSIYGVESGMIFLNYLFNKYPIRKVYCTVYKYNKMSFKFLQNAEFEMEGVLKEHRYFDGKYHDMMIFSFNREKLDDLNKRLKYSKK